MPPELHNTESFSEKDEDFARFAAARGIGPSNVLANPDHTPGAVLSAALVGGVPAAVAMPHDVMNPPDSGLNLQRMRPPGNKSNIVTPEMKMEVDTLAAAQSAANNTVPVATDKGDHTVDIDPREIGYVLEVAMSERNKTQSELTAAKGRISYLTDIINAQNGVIAEQRTKIEELEKAANSGVAATAAPAETPST